MRNAVTGPFSHNPFSCPVAVSPLNSVPKSDTTERQIILDLSWPVGSSENDGIQSGSFWAQEIALVYPTVDLLADRVAALGSGCLRFKRDLKQAYRQFPVDPRDYPLLGYFWNGNFYFDVVLPMGFRTAAMACQHATNAVRYILSTAGCHVLITWMNSLLLPSRPEHFVTMSFVAHFSMNWAFKNLHPRPALPLQH